MLGVLLTRIYKRILHFEVSLFIFFHFEKWSIYICIWHCCVSNVFVQKNTFISWWKLWAIIIIKLTSAWTQILDYLKRLFSPPSTTTRKHLPTFDYRLESSTGVIVSSLCINRLDCIWFLHLNWRSAGCYSYIVFNLR